MATKVRLVVTILLVSGMLMALTGCGRAFVANEPDTEPVDNATVAVMLQYLEDLHEGPLYTVEITLPEEWVGRFVTRDEGNVVYFDYVTELDYLAPIFSITALSEGQFWEQQGGYPGYQTNIVNTPDTYFVYHLPIDAWYSGLPKAEFQALADVVPLLMATVNVEQVQ